MSESSDPFPLMPEKKFVDFNDQPPNPPASRPKTPPQPIKTVKDLVNILSELQTRVEQLEGENDALRQALNDKVTKKETVQLLSRLDGIRLPKSGVFSDSFLVRAFSIYGHWFVANLLISIVLSVFFFILFSIIGASITNAIMQNLPAGY
ncbi:MAG: hypothetical protein HPY85_06670 [Anaerolineae bacterium]|nr:hypothetical protein [Anaerolineae bacterium]